MTTTPTDTTPLRKNFLCAIQHLPDVLTAVEAAQLMAFAAEMDRLDYRCQFTGEDLTPGLAVVLLDPHGDMMVLSGFAQLNITDLDFPVGTQIGTPEYLEAAAAQGLQVIDVVALLNRLSEAIPIDPTTEGP